MVVKFKEFLNGKIYTYDTLKDRSNGIKNNLSTDSIYEDGEPERAREVLQSWEALKSFCNEISSDRLTANLETLKSRIDYAFNLYTNANSILQLDTKSNSDNLEPMQFALSRFSQITEI